MAEHESTRHQSYPSGAEVAILIPAMRSHKIGPLIENIHDVTPEAHHVYVMTNREKVAREAEKHDGCTVFRDRLRSWGRRLNAMYKVTSEPYLFLGADDVWFHPNWYVNARRMMRPGIGIVAVNDLMNPASTLALVARWYIDEESGVIDKPRAIIHPGYRHNYSETELFETARSRGRWVQARDSVVEHHHFLVGKGICDEVYEMGIAEYGEDKERYLGRRHLWATNRRVLAEERYWWRGSGALAYNTGAEIPIHQMPDLMSDTERMQMRT